uniref:Uncharacterized protein n=1 Tax=Zea mays TaxID=4577 RepID=B6U2M8_MAIZE|nr:hypothetical protein [Zea mays]
MPLGDRTTWSAVRRCSRPPAAGRASVPTSCTPREPLKLHRASSLLHHCRLVPAKASSHRCQPWPPVSLHGCLETGPSSSLVCARKIEKDAVQLQPWKRKIAIRFRASRDQRSSVGDQVIQFFEFHKVEDPEHLFSEGCLRCNLCSGKEEGVEADL